MSQSENNLSSSHSTFLKLLAERPITLLKESSIVTREELETLFPNKHIIACDFPVEGIEENGEEILGGYKIGNITNIDHHALTDRMAKHISSTTLAIEYVKNNQLKQGDVVVIHHTDCDSVLSSVIMRGILSPDSKFNDAAIAADHTGQENMIADLLQSISDKRDLEFSLKNLELLLDNKDLEPEAKRLLQTRYDDRIRAKKLVESGEFKSYGDVYFVKIDERIDGELMPALIPNAAVILLAIPMKNNSSKLEIKVRLGFKAQKGFYIQQQNLPDFGGRWNAGSTKRSGGTLLSVEDYARIVKERLDKYAAGQKRG
jgi:hypothetical protein